MAVRRAHGRAFGLVRRTRRQALAGAGGGRCGGLGQDAPAGAVRPSALCCPLRRAVPLAGGLRVFAALGVKNHDRIDVRHVPCSGAAGGHDRRGRHSCAARADPDERHGGAHGHGHGLGLLFASGTFGDRAVLPIRPYGMEEGAALSAGRAGGSARFPAGGPRTGWPSGGFAGLPDHFCRNLRPASAAGRGQCFLAEPRGLFPDRGRDGNPGGHDWRGRACVVHPLDGGFRRTAHKRGGPFHALSGGHGSFRHGGKLR